MWLRKARLLIERSTVEPIVFLTIFAFSLYGPIAPNAQFSKLRREYAADLDGMDVVESANYIRRRFVDWNNYSLAFNLPFSMLMTTFLGAWSDRRGRQINMLAGMTSLVVFLCGRWFLWSNAIDAPLWTTLVFDVLSGLLGSYLVTWSAGQAYLADTTFDKEQLTIKLTVVSACRGLGAFLGSLLASVYAHRVEKTVWIVAVQAIITVNFFFCIWRIKQIPPKLIWRTADDDDDRQSFSHIRLPSASANICVQICQVALTGARLVWAAIMTYFKKRKGHRRAIILCLALTGLVEAIVYMEEGALFVIYTQDYPFYWTSKDYGLYNTVGVLLRIVGTLGGMFVMKKVLHFHDSLIVVIGHVFSVLSMLPIVFATEKWHFYLATVVGIFENVSGPAAASMLTQLVEPDEVGKVYTVIAFTFGVAVVIKQYVFQNIYKATLGWFPQFVWFLIIAMACGCVCVMIYVHVLVKRDHIGERRPHDSAADDELDTFLAVTPEHVHTAAKTEPAGQVFSAL